MTDQNQREIVVEEHPEIPLLSVVLGFGPMLPIAVGALVAWTTGGLVRGEAVLLSVVYASSILAFLAGVRRGLSFRTEGGPAFAQLATMAFLWLASFLAACIVHAFTVSALAILLTGYAALIVLDPLAARIGQAPLFFARLRPPQMLSRFWLWSRCCGTPGRTDSQLRPNRAQTHTMGTAFCFFRWDEPGKNPGLGRKNMKAAISIAAAVLMSAGAAYAQSDKPGMKPESAPGATEQGANSAGVAKDPSEVQKQQGGAAKASPGTVGAAPGADTKSQGK